MRRHQPAQAAARGALFLALAGAIVGIGLLLNPVGPALRAEPAEPMTASELTEFGYAPAVFAAAGGSPAPTGTPAPGATATPPTAATATPTATATATAGTPPPGATSTPTAAATATATQAPDLEPTPAANPLRVPETHTLITDLGRLTIRGEVISDGPRGVLGVRVPIVFLNKKGRVVHTEMALPMLNQLGPGSRTCFTVSLDPPKGWRSFEFGDIVYQLDPNPIEGLSVSDVAGGVDSLMGWFTLNGRVSNASTTNYSLLRLAATVYDASGQVVGCDFAYADNIDLLAGQTDTFEFLFADREYPDAAGWHIAAEGERR